MSGQRGKLRRAQRRVDPVPRSERRLVRLAASTMTLSLKPEPGVLRESDKSLLSHANRRHVDRNNPNTESPPVHYLHLVIAIICETIGTTALQASQQFTKLGPSLIVLVGYGASFYFMALALKVMPVGIVYAIWSGLGIVLIALIGLIVFGQRLDLPAMIGLGLVIAGILVIHLFSQTTQH